jgi:hypothetical protein
MEEVYATEQYIASMGNAAAVEPTILDNIDFDAVATITGTGRGVPQSIMRTADEVQQLRESRQKAQEAQAQQQQQQAMMEMAGGAVVKGIEKQIGAEPATGVMQ